MAYSVLHTVSKGVNERGSVETFDRHYQVKSSVAG